ncbi:MAG: TldD/PmbA family protein [Anaerolineae bacterium]
MMLGKVEAEAILARALAQSKTGQTEVLLLAQQSELTRFANNAIHQNVGERDAVLRVRAVLDHRVGVAAGNDLSDEGIADLVAQAAALAVLQPPDPAFPGLPSPQQYSTTPALDEATANCSPERRAKMVGGVLRLAADRGLAAAGALETSLREVAVANSNGLHAYHVYTAAEFTTVVMADDSSGYGFSLCGALSGLDVDGAGEKAVAKAIAGHDPRPLAAGRYPVILEPDATSDILGSMGYASFHATAVEEGCSFLCGRIGQPTLDRGITIVDDGLDPASLPLPFDYEGVARRRVTIIEAGIARGVVHDTYSAAKAGVRSTGHALPAPNPSGPYPLHLRLEPGALSLAELIAGTRRGLLVTRFHYTRLVHQPSVTVTGMTRDGTYLIQNGEIAYPVRNLRFTQSYLQALQQPVVVGSDARLCGEYGPYRAPSLVVPEFNFTGVTEF